MDLSVGFSFWGFFSRCVFCCFSVLVEDSWRCGAEKDLFFLFSFFFGVLFGDGRLEDEFSEMGWWVWFLRFEDMDGEIWSCFFGIFYGFELFFFCVLLGRLLADASVFFFFLF